MMRSLRNAQKHLTSLKHLYPWIKTPLIVGAPMKAISGPALAVAISQAGGIGFIGPGNKPQDLAPALTHAAELVSKSRAFSEDSAKNLPIGIGIQTWAGDLEVTKKILKAHKVAVAVVWFFAPRHGQEELNDWIRGVREVSPESEIWVQVASVKDAVAAAMGRERVDVLVIQGSDAGGHSLTQGAGIVALLPEVADALEESGAGGVPLIAAGGISDSRGVAAALALGASGSALGTRFLASKEAIINPGYQAHVIDASDGGQSTVRTQLYNHLRGTMDWPEAFDARGLVNQSWRDHVEGVVFEENKERYIEAMGKGPDGWGKEGRMATYAGNGVGLVNQVKSAGDIVEELRTGVSDITRLAAENATL